MGGSNRVEPLRKSEKELKRRPLSVRAGAQNSKHIWLRNVAKISSNIGNWYSPSKTSLLLLLGFVEWCLLAAGKLP